MRNFSIIVILILMECASNEAFQTSFPVKVSDFFYQIKGNQNHFTIVFKEAIPEEIKLKRLYFRNQTGEIKQISDQTATAIFIKPDFVLDVNPEKEYGNQPPIKQKQRFQLHATEAVLEFTEKGKIKHYKFTNVTEKSNK